MAEVGALSGRVSPACAGPIRPITGRPSRAPALLYPLRHHPPLRSGFRLATGRVGLTLLPKGGLQGGGATGAAAPCRPAGVGVPVASSAIWRSDPLTFWSRPPASWACFTVTAFGRAFACAQPFGLR